MNLKERQARVVQLFSRCTRILAAKANDYATEADAFQNFREIGELAKLTAPTVLFTLLAKHLMSIRKAVIDGTELQVEGLDERIIDAINYLAILYTLVGEHATDAERAGSTEH